MAEFKYQEPFPIENDTTVYRLLTKDYVKTIECEGRKILKIEREGLELLAPPSANGDIPASGHFYIAHSEESTHERVVPPLPRSRESVYG